MPWQLSNIRQKVRQVTGRYSSEELSNDILDQYINNYTQYTLPAELKLERNHSIYELDTKTNQATYTLPSGYTNFEPPGFIDQNQLYWYQDPQQFLSENPYNIVKQNIGTGDGATTVFSDTATSTPIKPGSVYVSDGVETLTNTDTTWSTLNVTLTGDLGGTGTVNYDTGAVSVTFNTATPDGYNVIFNYIPFVAGQPTAVLLYDNQFEFYPIPNQSYRFTAKTYIDTLVTTSTGTIQSTFTSGTDTPLFEQWGPLIAYGASRDIHSDYGEMEAYQMVTALYKEQQAYALRRTNQNLLNERANPHF